MRLWLRDAIDAPVGAARRAAPRAHRPRRAARRHDHARLHAPAGRAAGDLRPPPARLRGDARARRRAPRRLPPARQPAAAGQRRARRHELPDRPRARRARARLRRHLRATRSTPCPIATSRSSSRPRAALRDGAPVALRRGAGRCGRARASASSRSPTASAPAARSCRRRRTRTCPSSCAARPARVVGHLVGAARADEGRSRSPTTRTTRKTRSRCSTPSTRSPTRSRSWPTWSPPASRVDAGADARGGARGLRDGDRPRRLPGAARGCRSATRTRRSRARCATRRAAGCDLADLPLAELRAFSPLIGADVFAVLTLEGSVASRDHPGGTAPAQVRAARRRRARARSAR